MCELQMVPVYKRQLLLSIALTNGCLSWESSVLSVNYKLILCATEMNFRLRRFNKSYIINMITQTLILKKTKGKHKMPNFSLKVLY